MTPEVLNIRKTLNKAYLKVKPSRSQIELLKSNLVALYDQIKGTESEEHHKNNLISFLKNTFYDPNYYINTKGRNDLVIHNGKDAKSTVGVIIEAKRPGNRSEMPSKENLNSKAIYELVLYYLRERITQKNLEIKYLIATDLCEWFVFNAQDFEGIFAKNKKLVADFEKFEERRLSGTKTDFFYDDIAKPFIAEQEVSIPVTWFDLRDFESVVKNDSKTDDKKLIEVYKILSAEHLLKLPFSNDSNTLDKKFYSELLHIIGLEERKEGSKKLIGRKAELKRDNGSLIENTISILNSEDCLRDFKNSSEYGENKEEQLYHVALELSITWINRILFLKLLEGQLVRYHNGDISYKFLKADLIPNYDALNKLFFQVLAVKGNERGDHIKEKYGNIPYLNSSLFEPNELEHRTTKISGIDNEYTIPIIGSTVLRDNSGKKRQGSINTLHYLMEFLDAYDFSSEGAEDISEENKPLINASVLGLIFEKINGYKDGSFFTPGFITMYMCRETIRRAIVQKFNEAKEWNCETLDDLYNKIEDKKEANEIINSLKICDPAVGSGHFLVSALNEIIAIKSELKVLADSRGRVLRDYHVEVINDELVITDEDGEFYEYHPKNPESQRIQETLFHEKQTIIENCLFGVDINQNSVKICQLRLWIELLKNAYYRPDSGYSELETLPNIDINIKCGNSLISRYPLDADIKSALVKSKWTIDSYRLAIMTYRNAENKEEKASMRRLIDEIKSDFESEVARNDKRLLKVNKLKGELASLTDQQSLFELSKKDKAEWEKKVNKISSALDKLEQELEEIKDNKIFENAFEWRFEFPEVLNDEGDYIGFDVIIGNPPYIRQELIIELKHYLKTTYKVFTGTGDLFSYFYELSLKILSDKGFFCFINNTFDKTNAGRILRKYINKDFRIVKYIDLTSVKVFEEATTYPVIIILKKEECGDNNIDYLKIKPIDLLINNETVLHDSTFNKVSQNELKSNAWNFHSNNELRIFGKILSHKSIREQYGRCYRGIVTGFNEAFIINQNQKEEIESCDRLSSELLEPILEGKDLSKWHTPDSNKWIIFTRRGIDIDKYNSIKNHLEKYRKHLTPKHSAEEKIGRKPGTYKWFEIQDSIDYYKFFKEPKIVWPNLQNRSKFLFDSSGRYINAPGVLLPTKEKYLLAILNSPVVWYYLLSICVVRSGGYIEVKPQYFEQIPIPIIKSVLKSVLTEKIDIIQMQLSSFPEADISFIEKEINQIVYDLYSLTEEEIKTIEESID